MKPIRKLIAVARNEAPADLAVCGAQVFNVFMGEFEKKDVLVTGGYIAALVPGEDGLSREAKQTVNAEGCCLVPGFIDAHVHLESSMLCPEEFCAMAVANGVTTAIADPHEISNVMGIEGIQYMLDATEHALARILFMLPSCVPASHMDQAGATLRSADLTPFLGHPRIVGLGEMMNYPGLLSQLPDVMEKLEAIHHHNQNFFGPLRGLAIDGHAPFVRGGDLQAYAAAGIHSDHEASTVEEAVERLAAGMGLLLREGSGAKNMLDLVPAITEHNAHLCALCTDDRHPQDLVEQGSINFLVHTLVKDGRLPLPTILKMASYNTARLFSLRDIGAVAPGYKADFALYPENFGNWNPLKVWCGGCCVAVDGQATQTADFIPETHLRNRVVLQENISLDSLKIPDKGLPVRVIETVPYQLITRKGTARLPAESGCLLSDKQQDIAKLAVVERHTRSGRVGLGFVKGLGLRRGAIAATMAHDSHNLVTAGMNDADMFTAVKTLQKSGGGFTVCCGGEVLALLPLPLAGLFSDKRLPEVYHQACSLTQAVRSLGLTEGNDPFMTLAFLTLAVIPSLKLTDCGLVDVERFQYTSLYLEE